MFGIISLNSNAVIQFANNTDNNVRISYKTPKTADELEISRNDTATLHDFNIADISEMKISTMRSLASEYQIDVRQLKSDTRNCGAKAAKLIINKKLIGYDVSATCYEKPEEDWEFLGF